MSSLIKNPSTLKFTAQIPKADRQTRQDLITAGGNHFPSQWTQISLPLLRVGRKTGRGKGKIQRRVLMETMIIINTETEELKPLRLPRLRMLTCGQLLQKCGRTCTIVGLRKNKIAQKNKPPPKKTTTKKTAPLKKRRRRALCVKHIKALTRTK